MKLKAALVVFIIVGLSFTLYQLLFTEHSKAISAKEAEAMATDLYGGKVLNTKADETSYQISLENDKGIYELSVDGATEKVIDVKLIERKEILITVDEAKNKLEKELIGKVTQVKQVNKDGKPFVEATVEKKNKQYKIVYDLENKHIVSNQEVKNQVDVTPISKQEAKEIALKQLSGKVTDLSTVTTEKGPHYKVTVDGKKEDAHVYVQSNTGIVTSTYWTQLDKKDNDDNRDDDNVDDKKDDKIDKAKDDKSYDDDIDDKATEDD